MNDDYNSENLMITILYNDFRTPTMMVVINLLHKINCTGFPHERLNFAAWR